MKILVLRFSSIGDIVLTTSVVRCIKQQVPSATIHYLTKKAYKSILENNPYIDKLITFEASISEKLSQLKSEKYDCIIDLHNNIRTLKLKWKLGVKAYSFPKKNLQKFLFTTFKINRMPKVHVVDRYFKAVEKLGVKNDSLPTDYFLSSADELVLTDYNLAEKSYLAIAMGAQFATKQMPINLLTDVLNNYAFPIVLLGGKEDEYRSNELKKQLESLNIIDFCGKITLNQSAYLCKNAKLLLTADTGLMHIAACFETPIVSVWGNTSPDLGMYPYFPNTPEKFSMHEVKNLSCRPCSKIGHQRCPKGHFMCMTMQNTNEIEKKLVNRNE